MGNFKPSKYQEAIYNYCDTTREGNLLVQAVAGSGKTTTLEGISQRLNGSILFLAFNKSIATELAERLTTAQVSTMNAFGYRQLPRKKIDARKSENFIKFDLFDGDWHKSRKHLKTVPQLVSLCKANGLREVTLKQVESICEHHGIELEKESLDVFFSTWKHHCNGQPKTYDFDDQIWRPVVFDLPMPSFDWVMIDECQDLNPVMLMLLKKVKGRKIFVGDEAQAIYAFRGADQYAIANIRSEFDCTELPLSVCYRCGSEIIKAAQKIVPHIEWHWEGGQVNDTTIDKFDPQAGDLVVCRVTKDLVQGCLGLIRSGKTASIMGKEIGAGLAKMWKDGQPDFDLWASKKKFKSNEQQMIFEDKVATIHAIQDYSDDVLGTIEKLFDGNKRGVIFSTIHKAKGLEADNVWLLRPDLLPHPMAKKEHELVQEKNLHYVAITRAKNELNITKGEFHESNA